MKKYRLVLDTSVDGCVKNNATNSDYTFRNINLRALLGVDFDHFHYVNFRLFQVILKGGTNDTFANDEMNFEIKLSEMDTVYMVENNRYKPSLRLCNFDSGYGVVNNANAILNEFTNNEFTFRTTNEVISMRMQYINFDKSSGDIVNPTTNAASAYPEAMYIFILEPHGLKM